MNLFTFEEILNNNRIIVPQNDTLSKTPLSNLLGFDVNLKKGENKHIEDLNHSKLSFESDDSD